jgi:hypothetical protein
LKDLINNLFETEEFWKNILPRDYYPFLPEVINLLADERIVETIRKYNGENVGEVASGLVEIAGELKDKGAVLEISRIVGRYEGKVAGWVAGELTYVAHYLKDKDAVLEISRIVGRYEGENAGEVASGLVDVVYKLKDKDAVLEISRILADERIVETIRKYNGENVGEVVSGLAVAAYYLKNKQKVLRIVNMFSKVGKIVFDIDKRELYEIVNDNLDELIEDKRSLDSVIVYLKSKKELPRPHKTNIKDYEKVALEYIKSKYGIKKDLRINQILMLYSLNDNEIKNVVEFVNKSEEKNVKFYSLKAGEKTLDDYLKNYSEEKLMEYAVISIVGSRDKNKEKEAIDVIKQIIDEKVINRAKNEFNNDKQLRSEIGKLFRVAKDEETKKKAYEEAYHLLEQTDNKYILDVLRAINFKDVEIPPTTVVKAVESKNPIDYDSRVQIACVYLPRSRNVIKYCKDPKISLVRYDIGGETLGSVICYFDDKNKVFLVDSVEGHRRFRNDKIFEIVYNDLIERAQTIGADIVAINENVHTETSKQFVKYLEKRGLERGRVKVELNTEAYLEAGKDKINGYIVKLKDKARS